MPEVSLEERIEEQEFAQLLAPKCTALRHQSASIVNSPTAKVYKAQFFDLIHESNTLETFLDDYGARYNQAFSFLRELTASIRWIGLAGYSLKHLKARLRSYQIERWTESRLQEAIDGSLVQASQTIDTWIRGLLQEFESEATRLGLGLSPKRADNAEENGLENRRKLARNLGQAELVDEDQKIAGVATSFMHVCESFSEIGFRELSDAEELAAFFSLNCTESGIRVLEAQVHNLQSTYDTYIQNTVLESKDERLPRLRGCVSVALHALEASLYLAHFVERHEDVTRSHGESTLRIQEIVQRSELQALVVNHLMFVANQVLQAGLVLAEALVPTYTNVCEMRLELSDGTTLHARPAALIVGIVNHHGTPVELEIGDQRCNASSILELLVAVGSNPHERVFTFHGDERPLNDIRLLFENRLGESGLESLPPELAYLKGRA